MTDITELAQREKFEAWFVNDVVGAYVNFPAFKDGEYTEGEIYDEQLYFMLQAMWMAWKAAGAELVEALEKAKAINAAAEKLVRCKCRYHSEQNYRALAALFGVKTPDLPPLDSESSAVTVKLTDINEYLAEVHDKTLNRAFRLLAEGVLSGDVAAMRAAGIKVEAE